MASLFSNAVTLRKGIRITDQEFVQMRDFIYGRTGIYVDEKRKYLFESRFARRLGELGLDSFADYVKFLKYDPKRNQELSRLYELVTTNETSLFRDTRQLDAFRNNVLKEKLDEQRALGRRELRIWSAGCSSGEEPYTLSIILHEVLRMELARWRITITAGDLSPAMIAKAREGVYGDYAFKTTPPAIRERYFTREVEGWRVKPTVAKLVNFQEMNLNDGEALKRVPRSHIVFCRNVIIYFDQDMKRRVMSAFYDNLLPGGYMMLGHSETLHKISSSFKPIFHPGTIAYKKEG